MQPSPPQPPPPPRRRPSPWLVLGLVVVLVAVGLVVVALRSGDDDGGGAEVGAGQPGTTASTAPAAAGDASASSSTSANPSTTVAPVPPDQKPVFDALMRQVAEVRGLQWKSALNLRVVSKTELARRVREVTARDTNPEQLAAEEATLKLLGLIPADTDYRQVIDDLLAGSVVGFYDPETRELFVGAQGDGDELDPSTKWVIAHEMTHALTDQVFNYGPTTIALDKADKAEEGAALSALLEGDATITQNLWAERFLSPEEQLVAIFGSGGGDIGGLLRAPAYIQEALFFPYEDGETFVQQLHDAGGFAAVDAAYRNPPKSTEHILHPETYRAGQPASPPALPNLAAATGCRALRGGILGEFDMTALLGQHIPTTDAARASLGWNGDAYSLVRCGTALGLADRWETDPGTDAGRLTDALGRWAAGWSGGGRPGGDGRFSGPRGSGRIVRSGGRVDMVLAQDAETREKLVAALG